MKLEQKRFKFFNATHWFYIVLICLWVLPSLAWAGNSLVAPVSSRVEIERENWEGFTNRSNITALLLSDDGKTLWVGSNEGGLEERDAYSGEIRKIYTGQTGQSDLLSYDVNALISDGEGGLWVGGNGGLTRLKADGKWEMVTGLPYDIVYSLISDDQDGLWVGTGESGLAHLKADGKWEIFNSDNSGLPSNDINSILSDGQGGLWVGTYEKGLACLKADGKWTIFNKDNSGLPSDSVNSLILDGKGDLWVGTGGKGLACLKADGKWTIFNRDNSGLPSDSVNSLISDGKGDLWVGTGGKGLACLKADGKWTIFNRDNSGLPSDSVNSLISDGQNGLWVGTGTGNYTGGGLTHLKADSKWEVFTEENLSLPDNAVQSLFSDGQGDLWVGTYSGLAHMKKDNKWEIFNRDNSGLPSNEIESFLSDGQNGLWVGTFGGGLAHLNSDGKWEVFNPYNSELPSYWVKSLLSDGQNGLWVGTCEYNEGGLARLKADGTWDIFNTDNSELPNNNVYSLLSDGQNGLWVGTGGGLAHLKTDGKWEVFNTDNSDLPDNYIKSLLSDGQNGLWIATGRGGLAHLKTDDNWEVFNTENSWLPDNDVHSLLSDGQGGLWVGTWDGLALLDSNGKWKVFYYRVNFLCPDGQGGLWVATFQNGLAHLLLLGSPEQLIKPDSPEITINWFLNSSSLDSQNVKYIELQRSLSKDGIYETVLDASDNPVRFYADYSECPKPRVDNCWVIVEGHTPATKQDSDGKEIKGYTLNTPITDPEWLEGLPRYYRLSAVIEEDGKLVRVANNSEAALITPQVEEKPRVELTLDRNAIAMLPNTKTEITVFVSSLDLFRGDVALEIESATGSSISNNIKIELAPASVSLKAGETKPVLLTIEALFESTQTIKIIPKIESGYSGKSASLNVQVGDGTNSMIGLSIAHKTKRTRVLDALTISGNVIPAQAGQKVVISGNNIKESAESATFTTDENGYFQGSVTPIHAGLLTLTAKSNGITSNTAEIFILPARTNIALSSNVNQSTKKGDMLRVQGIITPVRLDGTKVNLDIRYLDPANQDAGLQPQFVGGVEIDANGVFYRDVVVPGNGFINVKASLPETSDYLSINTKLVIPIGQPVGEGIIVVSESGDADFQTISKSLGNYVYNALKSRNIPAERIKYLGIADDSKLTNGTANKANLHDALTNWATSLFSTDDPYKTPLNLYLIGKVEDDNNGFRLNDNEVLTADDLAQYLNEAEEIIKTNSKDNYSEYKGFPVTIVLEGTQSGKWIEKIAGNGRIILTSSSDKPVDEGGYAGYDNLGESSFSRYFYEFINYGSDIEGSFAEANYEILKFYRHTQRPVMDADGDGFGTTTNFDRYEASGKFIEYRPSGNLRPQIRTTNPDMTINRRIRVSGSQSDVDNPILWAIATDPENEMQGVFCSITDPSNRTLNIEMKQKSDKVNVYEADLTQTYPNLAAGCYHAVYYAKDKAGNVSLPEQKFLNVIANSGVLPQPPQIKITTKKNMVTISWSEIANADGYKLFYCPYPDCPPADIGEIDMGKQREITFDGKGFAFYGAVKAYNSNGLSDWSNVEFFNLR